MGLFNAASWDAFFQWMSQVGWQKLQKLGLVLLTCLLLLWAVRLVGRAVRRAVDDGQEGVTTEAERRAETLASVLNNVAWVVVAIFFILTSLQEFGINVGPLVAGAGIAGVALGFGAQSLVKDWISGFFLLMENQFGVGDIISVDDQHAGVVERMTLRITQLRDMEGRAHFIPNGSMVRVVVMSKEFARALVDVDVAYASDLDAALALLKAEGERLAAELPEAVLEPTEVLGVNQLRESGVTLRTLTKTAPGRQWEVGREFRRRIVLAFRNAGIEIPFPQRVVHHKDDRA